MGGDDWEEGVSDEDIDFLDAEEVSGGVVWGALDGDLELVIASQCGHGGFSGGGVVAGDGAVGVEGETDGSIEDVLVGVCGHGACV